MKYTSFIKEKIYTLFVRLFYKFEHIYNPNFNTSFKENYIQNCTFFDLQGEFKIDQSKYEKNLLITVIDRKINKNSNKYIFESWVKNKSYTHSDLSGFPFNSHKRKILKSFIEKPKKEFKKKIFLLPYYHNQAGHFMGDVLGSMLFFLELFKKRGLNEKLLIRCPGTKWEEYFKKFYKNNTIFLPDNFFIKKNIFFTKSQILPKFHPFQSLMVTKNILATKIENNNFKNKKVFLTSERVERISNIKEVIIYLKKKNFIILNPKKFSVLQLFKILNSAKLVVSECASISHNILISRNKPYYILLPRTFKIINKKWYRITGIYTNFHSSLYRPLYFESTDNRKYDIPLQQQIKVDLKKLNIL